jgi:hypothetical protein
VAGAPAAFIQNRDAFSAGSRSELISKLPRIFSDNAVLLFVSRTIEITGGEALDLSGHWEALVSDCQSKLATAMIVAAFR